MYKCMICKAELDECNTYEYRGAFSCAEHFDLVQERRETQRQEIIAEESAKTECFRGLPLDDSPVGTANREILKGRIEIAGKESGRLRDYEGLANTVKQCPVTRAVRTLEEAPPDLKNRVSSAKF